MLEFLLYLVSGVGYGFYFDLNLLETPLVIIALFAVSRGLLGCDWRRPWRTWVR